MAAGVLASTAAVAAAGAVTGGVIGALVEALVGAFVEALVRARAPERHAEGCCAAVTHGGTMVSVRAGADRRGYVQHIMDRRDPIDPSEWSAASPPRVGSG